MTRALGICDNSLQLLLGFLDSKKQWFMLSDQHSSWVFRFLDVCYVYLYKRSNRKSLIKAKTFCRLHFFIYDDQWSQRNCETTLCEFRKNKRMDLSEVNEFQSWPI